MHVDKCQDKLKGAFRKSHSRTDLQKAYGDSYITASAIF